MKIFAYLFTLVTVTFARTNPIDEVPERNADDDAAWSNYINPCAVSPDGTYKAIDGGFVEADYTFQMEYDNDYDAMDLLRSLNKQIGNTIIQNLFRTCQTRTRGLVATEGSWELRRRMNIADISSIIQGLDTNPNYKSTGDCTSSNDIRNTCEEFHGGIKIYIDTSSRKLMVTNEVVIDSILVIIQSMMDSGDAAREIDGIEKLKFYSNADSNQDADEEAAKELEKELIDVPKSTSNPDEGETKDSSSKNDRLKAAGWGMLGVSALVIVGIGYRYNRTRINSVSLDDDDIEVEDVLIDSFQNESRGHIVEDSVEVVFD